MLCCLNGLNPINLSVYEALLTSIKKCSIFVFDMNIIERNIDSIKDLCLKYKVRRLFAFGSVITDRFKSDSDVDLIVDFNDVDLLEEKAIKNPYFRKSID